MLYAGVGKEMAADYDHRSCLPSGAMQLESGPWFTIVQQGSIPRRTAFIPSYLYFRSNNLFLLNCLSFNLVMWKSMENN